jgi:hypothetical protein
MIRKSENKKKVEEATKKSGMRRLLRKREAKKFNEFKITPTLDPKKYKWKSNCKKCLGRGIMGLDAVTKEPRMCRCVKRIQEKKEE